MFERKPVLFFFTKKYSEIKRRNIDYNLYSVSCYLSLRGIGPYPTPTGTGPAPTCLDQHQSWTGLYRVSNGLCRCLTIDIDRYRPVLVWCRSKQVGTGLNRSVPVGPYADRFRYRREIARNAVDIFSIKFAFLEDYIYLLK